MLGAVLRLYSYLYHLALSLFLFLIAVVVLTSGKHNLEMPMLPWEGASLTHWLLLLSLIGIIVTVLAILGRFRYAFPLWCLFVVFMMIRGYFLSSYYYTGGEEEFHRVLWLFAGAVVAFLGSLTLFARTRTRP